MEISHETRHSPDMWHCSKWHGEVPWLKSTWIYSLKLWNEVSTSSGIPMASSTGEFLAIVLALWLWGEEPGQLIHSLDTNISDKPLLERVTGQPNNRSVSILPWQNESTATAWKCLLWQEGDAPQRPVECQVSRSTNQPLPCSKIITVLPTLPKNHSTELTDLPYLCSGQTSNYCLHLTPDAAFPGKAGVPRLAADTGYVQTMGDVKGNQAGGTTGEGAREELHKVLQTH